MKNCLLLRWGNPASNAINQFLLVMRFTTILLLLGTLHLSGNTMSQTVTLNVQNVHLKRVFAEVERQTGYTVLYSDEVIDKTATVSVNVKEVQLEKFLTNVLSRVSLTYRIDGSSVFIKSLKRRESLKPKPQAVFAVQQQRTVTGKVTDDFQNPLEGVTVTVKGTSVVTTTDPEGNFHLQLPENGSILSFSIVGFSSIDEVIGDRTSVNVGMTPSISNLEEVVVVGYGTMERREVTSAISHISADELAVVGANDPLMRIQGKVAGLTIQNTGAADPNSTAGIQLRGATTRSTNELATGPLVVIDGVPGGNLQSVNENDIASIDILKDGAASAIYGTRASNGVILITTKRGVSGEPRMNYIGFSSFDVPTMALKPLNADQWREIGRGTDFGHTTDWMDLITNDFAFTHKHTLSVTGGSNRTTYRGTIDFQNSDGLDIRSNRRQYGARLNVNHTGGDGLYDIILNIAPRFANRKDGDRNAFTQALNLNPTMPVMDPENPDLYYLSGGWEEYNPVEQLKLQQVGREERYLDWNATFKLNLLPNLNTQVQLAQVSRDHFLYSFSPSIMTTQIRDGNQGTASRDFTKTDQYSLEWLANYSLNVGKHDFRLLGVYSYQYFLYSGLNAENRDFSSDALTYNDLGNGTYNLVAGRNGFGSTKGDHRLISFRARVNYAYDDKYLLSASLTRDGSSRFGENNKWGYFPGISLGWRVSEEPFMRDISWINDLKIRADYGETGNQEAIGNYQSLLRYEGFNQYMYDGSYVQVWGPSNNANPDLRWEKLKNWNVGLDFSLLQNRLGGSINYYTRRAVDLLGDYNAPLPPNIVNITTANVGEMSSNGVEIELRGNIINKERFSYNISLNGATLNSVFRSFSNELYKGQSFVDQMNMPAPGSPGNTQRLQEGKRLGMFYFWKYAGVSDDGNIMVYNKNGEAIPGSAATQDDKAFVGNGQPKFVGGMTHTVKYRNWDASASFRGNFGYDIFNVHEFYYGLQSMSANTNVLARAYDENAAITGDKLLVDYFLEKGDFLKLDVVSLGYTYRPSWKNLNSVRVYASTRNLLTFTKFTGVDPDNYPINGQNPGIVNSKAYYPSTTQFLIGLQLDF